MLFSSTLFVFAFLPIVLAGYFLLPGIRARNAWLLSASLLFYAWGEHAFVAVLLASIALSWAFGPWIARGSRLALGLAIAANLVLLGVFKYTGFAFELLGELGLPTPELTPPRLPIGISFFTFQALTYAIDLYRGVAPLQRSPTRVALYISLFPQLVAGPIVRYGRIAAQLGERRTGLAEAAEGARRFVWGLGKKVLVADTLAAPVDAIFALPPDALPPSVAWLGLACFTLQIYFDFSGYSDMAIGLGRIFGFRFPENFRHPYASHSVREFWRRWHMTLSSWFRDYLYIPLGGSRRGATRTYANLVVVFLLCGLWHGAALHFVVWGLLHGALLVAERAGGERWLARLPGPAQWLYTLGAVSLAWVFFRAPDLGHALGYLGALFGAGAGGDATLARFLTAPVALALLAGALGAGPWLEAVGEAASRRAPLAYARVTAMALVLLLCGASLAVGTHQPFIYFRF